MKKFRETESVEEFFDNSIEDFYADSDFANAFTTFADFLEKDKDLFRAYCDNMVMSFMDAFDQRKHLIDKIETPGIIPSDNPVKYILTLQDLHLLISHSSDRFLKLLIYRNNRDKYGENEN